MSSINCRRYFPRRWEVTYDAALEFGLDRLFAIGSRIWGAGLFESLAERHASQIWNAISGESTSR